MVCSLIGYEEDYSKHIITMEMDQAKDSEKLWHSKISLNGKWEIEEMIFGQDTPPPMPLRFGKMGP